MAASVSAAASPVTFGVGCSTCGGSALVSAVGIGSGVGLCTAVDLGAGVDCGIGCGIGCSSVREGVGCIGSGVNVGVSRSGRTL